MSADQPPPRGEGMTMEQAKEHLRMHMHACPICGNKRCPKAKDHANDCTGSNQPDQIATQTGVDWVKPPSPPSIRYSMLATDHGTVIAEPDDFGRWVTVQAWQEMQADRDGLRDILRMGLAMQKPGDIWSVQPDKMRAFKEAAEKALAASEPKGGEG